MADELDNMSDADIRTRLSEFGFPMVPITATTRKTMVKKLKMLLENQKHIASSNRMSLAKYSSGEDSDVDTNKKKVDKSRRYTVGQMLPPTSSKKTLTPRKASPVANEPAQPTRHTRRTIARDLTNDIENESSGAEESSRSHRVTRFHKTITTNKVMNNSNSAYSDSVSDSDDDVQIMDAHNSPVARSSPARRDSPILSSIRKSPLKQTASSSATSTWQADEESYKPGLSDYKSSLPNRMSSYVSPSHHSPEKFEPSLSDKYGSGLQSNRDTKDDYNNMRDNGDTAVNNYESPFLSEFTRRLESTKRQYSTLTPHRTSLLSDDSGVTYTPTRSPITSINNTQSNYRNLASFNSRRPAPTRPTMGFDNIFKKSNIIPLILVAAAAMFFVCVGFMYVGMKGKPVFQIDAPDHNIPLCQPAVSSSSSYVPGQASRPGVNCVLETSVKPALQLFRYILPELHARAVDNACKNPHIQPYMANVDIIEFIKKENAKVEPERVMTDLDNLHVLILKNPQWGASVIEKTDSTIIANLDDMLKSETYQNIAIAILNPDLPLSCVFSNKLVNIVYTSALIISGLIVAFGLQFIIKFGLKKREERNKAVYSMVERILEVLSQEAGEGDDSYLAINHVRDRLILPQERKNMSRIWDDAVHFLEQNDSRVRSEVQNVAGEDCRVWRWLAMGNHNAGPSSPRNKNKVWQGQAFETQEGSVNNLPVSPTPCLKIRQMIDKQDDIPNIKSIIQDAILEKCGDDCNILHVHVDQQMLCVYVKCASRKDAGVAYRRLHGCWFDGKLITVKYVRLERYMERFPDSPINPPYLRPSNNKKSSLQFFKMDNSDNL